MSTFHESNFPITVSFLNQSWASDEEEMGSVTLQILHFKFPSQPPSLKPWFANTLETCMHMIGHRRLQWEGNGQIKLQTE